MTKSAKQVLTTYLVVISVTSACGGTKVKPGNIRTKKTQQQESKDNSKVRVLPLGSVHPQRTGVRTYPESYYEPTLVPSKETPEEESSTKNTKLP